MHFKPALTALFLSIGLAAPASAAIVNYDIVFDTPTYSDPAFSSLNSAFLPFGPTITGTLWIDTDKKHTNFPTVDSFSKSEGGFALDLEWDSIFDHIPSGLYTTKGTAIPDNAFYYYFDDISLDFFFPGSGAAILRASVCNNIYCDYSTEEEAALTNFSVTEISAVPVPAALPLLGAGLGMLGFMGWRRKAAQA